MAASNIQIKQINEKGKQIAPVTVTDAVAYGVVGESGKVEETISLTEVLDGIGEILDSHETQIRSVNSSMRWETVVIPGL